MDLLQTLESSDEDETEDDENVKVLKEKRPSDDVIEKPRKFQRIRGAVKVVSSECVRFERSVAHKRGHWSGHVRLPLQGLISGEVQQLRLRMEDRGYSGTLASHEDLHVSLSRPFYLQLANIEPFVEHLSQLIKESKNFHMPGVDRCAVIVNDVSYGRWLVNEERTRSFWCLPISPVPAWISWLVGRVDSALEKYGQQGYYKSPIYHVSIASVAGDIAVSMPGLSFEGLDVGCTFATDTNAEDNLSSNKSQDRQGLNSDEIEAGSSDGSSTTMDNRYCFSISSLQCLFGGKKCFSIDL